MKTFFIYPYSQGSESAKMLRDELGGKLILRENSTFKKTDDRVVINWGASDCPAAYKALNKTVKGILNKKAFFERLKDSGCLPPFAFTQLDAADNLKFPILCRTKLEGKDGEGIVIAEKFSQLVPAKLYTQYIDKTSEYRVHVGRGAYGYEIIGSQKKVKKTQYEGTNTSPDPRLFVGDDHGLIWTSQGQPVHIPTQVKEVVEKAFNAFPELDFCAFDAIYDNSTGKAYVLEANSAPMGTPETMKRYGKFFRSLFPDAVTHSDFVANQSLSGNTIGGGTSPSAGSPAAQAASPTTPAVPAPFGDFPTITVEQVKAAQVIINAYISQQG